MRAKWNSVVGSTASALLPEGSFKESLRRWFWRRNDPLPALAKVIAKTELMPDDVLFVELEDDTKLYVPRDSASQERLKHIDKGGLGKMKAFEHFGSSLGLLREQFVERIYEKHYQPKRGDVVVDVGAHIGTYSLRAARAVGDDGRVIAIEPATRNLRFLRRNLEANGLRNVVVVPKGAWSARGKATLKIFEDGTGLNSFYDHAFDQVQEATSFEEVEVDTVDNMLEELGVRRVDFVKMDIEGAEIEALEGMSGILEGDVNLAIAAYHIVDGKKTHRSIVPRLEEKEFEIHTEGGITYGTRSHDSSEDS